jgi:hypothetical protein
MPGTDLAIFQLCQHVIRYVNHTQRSIFSLKVTTKVHPLELTNDSYVKNTRNFHLDPKHIAILLLTYNIRM